MVLGGEPPGRVGRCRDLSKKRRPHCGRLFACRLRPRTTWSSGWLGTVHRRTGLILCRTPKTARMRVLTLRPRLEPRGASVTYSIVARDPETGEFGVGAQSHFFGVGSI